MSVFFPTADGGLIARDHIVTVGRPITTNQGRTWQLPVLPVLRREHVPAQARDIGPFPSSDAALAFRERHFAPIPIDPPEGTMTAIYIDQRGVVELDATDPQATVCGVCLRGWDDSIATACTPVPSARCPYEHEHDAIIGYDSAKLGYEDRSEFFTFGDEDRAALEGWAISHADGGATPGLHVERIDTQETPGGVQLQSDPQAWRLVWNGARAGSRVHRRALRLIFVANRPEYDLLVAWCQQHDPKEDA